MATRKTATSNKATAPEIAPGAVRLSAPRVVMVEEIGVKWDIVQLRRAEDGSLSVLCMWRRLGADGATTRRGTRMLSEHDVTKLVGADQVRAIIAAIDAAVLADAEAESESENTSGNAER